MLAGLAIFFAVMMVFTLTEKNADGTVNAITHGTGYARDGTSPIPKPTSLILLGSGLLISGFVTRKLRRRN